MTIHGCHMIMAHMVNPLSILRLFHHHSPGWHRRWPFRMLRKKSKSLAVAASRTWRILKQIGCAKRICQPF
jgi:hypothetical protein